MNCLLIKSLVASFALILGIGAYLLWHSLNDPSPYLPSDMSQEVSLDLSRNTKSIPVLSAANGDPILWGCSDLYKYSSSGKANHTVDGGNINWRAMCKPAPIYPSAAKAASVSGIVTVRVLVDEAGKVESARAIEGHPLLMQAAVEAAYKAQLCPTKLGGETVKLRGLFTYNFRGE